MTLEGKTIARVEDLGYDGLAVVFTDGTAAQFQGTGYETDGCSVDEMTEMDVIHMQALAEDERRESRARNERARARYETGEMKGMERVMYESIMDSYLQTIAQINRQFVGRSAVIPFKQEGA